jgi:hypothetical protein
MTTENSAHHVLSLLTFYKVSGKTVVSHSFDSTNDEEIKLIKNGVPFLLDGTKGKQDDEMNELLEPWVNLISSLSHSYRDNELAICLHITNDADLETVEKLVGLLPQSMIVNVVWENRSFFQSCQNSRELGCQYWVRLYLPLYR